MTVDQIMTPNPVCCTPVTPLDEVARLMVEHDCGEIPVVQSDDVPTLVGVVTDRDIVSRAVARRLNPLDLPVGACMSEPAIAVRRGTSLEACCGLMEERQIRRMPVVEADGRVCGIVSQADIAAHGSQTRTAQLVKEVSEQPRSRTAGGV